MHWLHNAHTREVYNYTLFQGLCIYNIIFDRQTTKLLMFMAL